jgi:hypothetical protein
MRAIPAPLVTALYIFSVVAQLTSECAMAQPPKRIYLAGPLGFSEAGNEFKDALIDLSPGISSKNE